MSALVSAFDLLLMDARYVDVNAHAVSKQDLTNLDNRDHKPRGQNHQKNPPQTTARNSPQGLDTDDKVMTVFVHIGVSTCMHPPPCLTQHGGVSTRWVISVQCHAAKQHQTAGVCKCKCK